MAQLSIYGKPVTTIFQLLGEDENDISYSIGWSLANSPSFLRMFVQEVTGQNYNFEGLNVRLQAHQSGKGFTDFELDLPGQFYLIIEAKKGWSYPTHDQLRKYATRKDFNEAPAPTKKLIVFTDCSPDYNQAFFTNYEVEGYPINVLSYRQIYDMVRKAQPEGSNAEKRLLIDLRTYLKTLITMQDKTSNMVWVVSLSDTVDPVMTSLSYKEVVAQKKIYFHPINGNSRKEPPNYIAFRFDNQLQAIHHVERYQVFKNPRQLGLDFADNELNTPYFAYHLGSVIPCRQIPNGPQIVMANRVECMLDTLLTSRTISDALNVTRARLQDLNNPT